MFLTDLTPKPVFVGNNRRGVCLGVGISLKSHAVKYLFCSSIFNAKHSASQSANADFAVGISSVCAINDQIHLSKLRSVVPKNCVKIFIGMPVYSNDGVFLGNVADVELQNYAAIRLLTDTNVNHSILSIANGADALILRKEQPFPLGQRIPAPLVSHFSDKTNPVVTRPILRNAIQNGRLIALTLSLPPFQSFS